MLLAEVAEGGKTAVIIAVTSTISVTVLKLCEFVWNAWKEKRGENKAEREKIEDHLEARVDRLEKDNARCDKRVRRLSRQIRELENSKTQLSTYVNLMRQRLRDLGEDFDEFREVPLPPDPPEDDDMPAPGSHVHVPLGSYDYVRRNPPL